MAAAADLPLPAVSALPPGPRLPVAVQGMLVMSWFQPFMRWCSERYGDAFTLHVPIAGRMVLVSRPGTTREVFGGDPAVLRAGEANAILEPFMGRHSVLLLDGREHLEQRRMLLPPFHGERMRRWVPVVTAVTEAEMERWPRHTSFPLLGSMQAITLEVILRAVFGVGDATRRERLAGLLRRLLRYAGASTVVAPCLQRDLGMLTTWGRFLRLRDTLDTLLLNEIAERRVCPDLGERDDVLSLLLRARHDDGSAMGDQELRDELMTLLLAGHETTATALAWCVDLLLRHPDAHARLMSSIADGDDRVLDAVIRETLRLRPVVPEVARRLARPLRVGDWLLPAGTVVAPSIYLTHRRADLWPEPERFRPERFLGEAVEGTAWLPFGGGVRRCLGASFALMEMRAVLCTMVPRARLRPAGGGPRVTRRMVVLAPSDGVRVSVERTTRR